MTAPKRRPRGRPPSEARKDWARFLLRMPPDLLDAVRDIAARDELAPSVNTVFITLVREALAARAARKR